MTKRRAFFWVGALSLAVAVGVTATIAGALFNRSLFATDCSSNPCVTYYDYGWPLEWKTNAPASVIQAVEADDTRRLGWQAYRTSGFAPGVFQATVIIWSLAALAAEVIVALGVRRLIRTGG